MAIRLDDDETPDVQMAPLIDCVFLLIAFFLVATTMRQARRELAIDLPTASPGEAVSTEAPLLIVAIDRDGRIAIDGMPVEAGALRARLAAAAAGGAARRVRIDGDRAAPLQSVVDVLDACRLQGLSAVGLQSRAGGAAGPMPPGR
jgi:biopolymer transport protein ExbD